MELSQFNLESIPEFEILPVGEYTCIISEAKEQDAKSGSGTMIVFTIQVVEGEYSGRKIWDRF